MKTIIVSDIHNRVDWIEPTLSLLKYDNVIFIGDYFDDFGDTHKDAENTANWLKQSLQIPNRIHLMGTHDMWYMFKYSFLKVSGNSDGKRKTINKILSKEDWEKLEPFYIVQNFYLTHAGIHPKLIKNNRIFNTVFIETKKAFNDIKNGNYSLWFGAGKSRRGYQQFGGITWLDWNEEFVPIPNINQIVGHTTFYYPQVKHTENSKNYCLDTQNRHIGILEDGKFSWIETKDINSNIAI